MTAIGISREAYDRSTKIPDDLSVIGFDDIHLCEFTIAPLTTVQIAQAQSRKDCMACIIARGGVPYQANRENETGSGARISLSLRHNSESRIAHFSLR
jgi:LacI family transcriptional regulator, galactose operon repressor